MVRNPPTTRVEWWCRSRHEPRARVATNTGTPSTSCSLCQRCGLTRVQVMVLPSFQRGAMVFPLSPVPLVPAQNVVGGGLAAPPPTDLVRWRSSGPPDVVRTDELPPDVALGSTPAG